MKKGALSRLFRKLLGGDFLPEDRAPLPVPLPHPVEADFSGLNEKWSAAPFLKIADFMQAFKRNAERVPVRHGAHPLSHPNVYYFTLLTGLQTRMADGEMPFYFPRPGRYDYPERDLFFAEHCYIDVSELVGLGRQMLSRGQAERAAVFIAALRDVAEQSGAHRGEDLAQSGYLYEDGKDAPRRYFVSALEMGSTFATVLRHRDGGDRARKLPQPVPLRRLPSHDASTPQGPV